MCQHSQIRDLGIHLARGISIKHVGFASKMTYYEMRIIPKCFKAVNTMVPITIWWNKKIYD